MVLFVPASVCKELKSWCEGRSQFDEKPQIEGNH